MKRLRIDYHIHSYFSADSKAEMEDIVSKAIAKGYDAIAFSDHFDLVPSEIAFYGVPSYYQYSRKIEEMRTMFPSIKILKGIELGEYHECYEMADAILNVTPPDIKIGAIHVLPPLEKDGKKKVNVSIPLLQEVTPQLIKSYYAQNLELVRYGNFDILAHLGVYKRYLTTPPDESCAQDTIDEIFRLLIKKDIALEVNYSGRGKPYRRLIPEVAFLERYREMGGDKIVIGSDAHRVEDFDVYYDETAEILFDKLGFQQVEI